MPNAIRDIRTVDHDSFPYIFEKNVSVPLKDGGVVRCNVYRPKSSSGREKYPVLATYGPYGKDIKYSNFHPQSFAEVNPEHQTEHSAWETPTPEYWTAHGYVVVRADEVGTGQSPGVLDVLSASTVDHFCELIEWAAEQEWSTGKVGLLGISYYAAIQWKVAARQPKGLAAAIPWEGLSDMYRDAYRHGGILSNGFFEFWWPRQVESNQYGLAGRAARNWGEDTIEGDLSAAELAANRVDLLDMLPKLRYRDQGPFVSVDLDLANIKIPILSVANWGGYLLHLRGNVQGYMRAGSSLKYLRFIVGRHDLPFYHSKEAELQRSFLDAFLKNDDRVGWSRKGEVPPVSLILRKGDVGFNKPEAEASFRRRNENEWPIARTQYTEFYLRPDGTLESRQPSLDGPSKRGYLAPGDGQAPSLVSFTTSPFKEETEITGHIVAHLNVSMTRIHESSTPSDIDLFVTLRHISPKGNEVLYTGTVGDPIPVTKGFLRVSLRKVNNAHRDHKDWLPHRDYHSSDVQPVIPGDVYAVDVELWPTNVVVDVGGRLVFEISSGDTAGTGIFHHNNTADRPLSVFEAENHIHFGPELFNYITLPIIPSRA